MNKTARLKPLQSGMRKAKPYLFILPSMLFFAVFAIYPLIYIIVLSFFDRSIIGDMTFVGFENFIKLFNNPEFGPIMKNTVVYMVIVVLLTTVFSMLVALLLQRPTRLNKIVQQIAFSPYVISTVSVVFVWMWMMDADYGLFNYIIGWFGLGEVNWLTDPNVTIFSIAIVSVWKSLGYNAIIIIAALNAIPKHYYEAAKLDNSSSVKTYFRITLPMISPTVFFLVLINIIGALKNFETIKLMTAGKFDTTTLVYFVYQNAREYFDFGYASSAGVILMVFIAIITLLYFKVLAKKVYYR